MNDVEGASAAAAFFDSNRFYWPGIGMLIAYSGKNMIYTDNFFLLVAFE